MASVWWRTTAQLSSGVVKRWASVAAAIPLTQAPDYHDPNFLVPPPSPRPAEGVKISKLSNGVTVASLENNSSCCNVAMLVKAGSRVESYEQRGITHLLRNSAYLNTAEKSTFAQMREVDFLGGNLSASFTRDHFVLSANFMRGNLDQVIHNLGSAVSSPLFKDWEIIDQTDKLKMDTAVALSQPKTVVIEGLHKAAFRSGLNNPLYCPPYNAGKFSGSDLRAHYGQWFKAGNVTVVGVGVDHVELVRLCELRLSTLSDGDSPSINPSDYVGGSELFIDSGSSLAHAAIASKAPGLSASIKDHLTAGVLKHVLGLGPYVKYGSNTATARLAKAVAESVQSPFSVNALNITHSDIGLFGFYAVANGNSIGQVLKSAMVEFSKVAQGDVSADDLTRAKNQFKAQYLMCSESQSSLVEDIGQQVSLKGSYTPVEDCVSQIDSITTQDIVTFAKMLFGTRATLVAHGNLSTVPRLDQLLSGVKLK